MAKRNREPPTLKAALELNGVLYDVDEMTPEQRKYLGTNIKLGLLNGRFMGRAVFTANLPPAEDVFPQLRKSPTV